MACRGSGVRVPSAPPVEPDGSTHHRAMGGLPSGFSASCAPPGARRWRPRVLARPAAPATLVRCDGAPPVARVPGGGHAMRPLRYAINVTLDGCCHHEAGLPPDEESMRFWTEETERADALLFGRVTYQMMEAAWRRPASGAWPDWMGERDVPFAEAIDGARKHVV